MSTFGSLILESARTNPERPALIVRDRVTTYRELIDMARTVADAAGLEEGGRVVVLSRRNEVAFASTVATACAGGTFVHVGDEWPPNRIADIVARTRARGVVVDAELWPVWLDTQELLAGAEHQPRVTRIDREQLVADRGTSGGTSGDALRWQPAGSGEDLAYVLFTSGSTGVPKGVPITSSQLLTFHTAMQARWCYTPDDCLSQCAPLTSDFSVFDMVMAWGGGAGLCVFDRFDLVSPYRRAAAHRVTSWACVPTVISLLQRVRAFRSQVLPNVRLSVFSGEALSYPLVRAWRQVVPNAAIENMYGPTETTIACSVHRADPADDDREGIVPIGQLLPGVSAVLLDEDGRPADARGELCVAGRQIFDGYWADEPPAADHFVELPGAGGPTRYYRTGDLVERERGGLLRFRGRVDSQVKVRGYRIELGEIESAFRAVAGVVDAVAIPLPAEAVSHTDLIVVLVLADGAGGAAGWASAANALPPYMRPSCGYGVAEIPRTTSGKLARRVIAEQVAAGGLARLF